MSKTAIAALAATVAMAFVTPVLAQRSPQRPTYEQCYQLGLARGYIVSVGDWRNFEKFIAECMAGKVPF